MRWPARVGGVAEVVEVSCRVCPGLIDRVPADEAADVARQHFTQLHPGLTPVAGEHYTAAAAALVCDTCLAVVELPWWEHVPTPPTPAAGQADPDGQWLLCDACHDLAVQHHLSAWVRRAWASHLDRAPWMAQASPALRTDMRAELAATLRTLTDRLDPGHRVSL
jgi:hypothetical protein